MILLFTGWDAREAVGWHAFAQSVVERSSEPVALVPIGGQARDGSNAFTYARFLVPHLCGFKGYAIFLDGADMLALGDLAEMWGLRHEMMGYAVMVAKRDYRTRHRRKYLGTEMEADNRDYLRKNWSSAVLWDCGHYSNRVLTPAFVAEQGGEFLHRFGWLDDDRIGALPQEWNFLVGEEEGADARLAHFTLGIPGFSSYRACQYSDEWEAAVRRSLAGLQTHELKEKG